MNSAEARRSGQRWPAEPDPPAPAPEESTGPSDLVSGLSRQNSAYRRVIALCDEIADAALQGADVHELAKVCAGLLGKTVVLLDADFGLRAHSGPGEDPGEVGTAPPKWDPDDTSVRRLLAALASEGRPLRVPAIPDSMLAGGCLATPIAVGTQKLGYLLILQHADDGEKDDADLLVASHAATLFALTLANEQATIALGRRYQGAIVDSLVGGQFLDRDDARRKLDSLDLEQDQPFRVGVVSTRGEQPDDSAAHDAPDARDELDRLAGSVAGAVGGAAPVVRGIELVILLPEQPDSTDGRGGRHAVALQRLAEVLFDGSTGSALTCGISETARAPDLAPRLLRQAQYAADIGARIGRSGQLIMHEELGIYRLLLQIGDLRQLGQFADEVLGSLLRYDSGHRTYLVRTLSTYLNEHASIKQTARRLRVHTNTVGYRIQRIQRLAKLDLDNPDDRLAAHVAIKIIESQGGEAGLDGVLEPTAGPRG